MEVETKILYRMFVDDLMSLIKVGAYEFPIAGLVLKALIHICLDGLVN